MDGDSERGGAVNLTTTLAGAKTMSRGDIQTIRVDTLASVYIVDGNATLVLQSTRDLLDTGGDGTAVLSRAMTSNDFAKLEFLCREARKALRGESLDWSVAGSA